MSAFWINGADNISVHHYGLTNNAVVSKVHPSGAGFASYDIACIRHARFGDDFSLSWRSTWKGAISVFWREFTPIVYVMHVIVISIFPSV